MDYTFDIVNNSDNKSFVITRSNVTGSSTNTSFVPSFCLNRSTPLVHKAAKSIEWVDEALMSQTVLISNIKNEDDSLYFDSATEFPDGICTIVMTSTVSTSTPTVTEKKLFAMNKKETIYRAACSFAFDDVMKSDKRITENLFNAYMKLKGMNASAVTGLEDELMLQLEVLDQLCLTL